MGDLPYVISEQGVGFIIRSGLYTNYYSENGSHRKVGVLNTHAFNFYSCRPCY